MLLPLLHECACFANLRFRAKKLNVCNRALHVPEVLRSGFGFAVSRECKAPKRLDLILQPTSPSTAFKIGEKSDDPVSMYLSDIYTIAVNLAGLPGIAVPGGLSATGLPLGLQLIGKAFDEATLLRAARAVEVAADFKAKPTPWWRAA